ncbi:unnamed protein product [Anisakis simplex]|uniref:Cadherin domain-containing protein n=1 Tax=Anisakis simplex TaxID=6269 RepID=A0A0M3JQ24_ANISI|nr:unnamed protein product [Anisakis simplex]
MLRYSIVNTPNSASLPNGRNAALYGGFSRRLGPQQLQFSVDSDSGEIYAEPDLLAGIHRFNVTVTDGKFTSRALVTVDVSIIRHVPFDLTFSFLKQLNNVSKVQCSVFHHGCSFNIS